jgi:hypothetical protein
MTITDGCRCLSCRPTTLCALRTGHGTPRPRIGWYLTARSTAVKAACTFPTPARAYSPKILLLRHTPRHNELIRYYRYAIFLHGRLGQPHTISPPRHSPLPLAFILPQSFSTTAKAAAYPSPAAACQIRLTSIITIPPLNWGDCGVGTC